MRNSMNEDALAFTVIDDFSIFGKAHLFWRVIANIIDVSVIFIFFFMPMIFSLLFSGILENYPLDMTFVEQTEYFSELEESDSPITYTLFLMSLFTSCLGFFYFVICEYFLGMTLGKNISGIAVLNINKETIDFQQALGRNLVKIIPFLHLNPGLHLILMLFLFIDIGYALFDPKSQRFTDKWFNTVVVNESVYNLVINNSKSKKEKGEFIQFNQGESQ